MTVLIDYDAGNLRSVEKALLALGDTPLITRDPERIEKADRVILPGVGAFADCVGKLRSYGLEAPLKGYTATGRPFLGICVGMQVLLDFSEEGMEGNGGKPVPGLGILPGGVRRIPDGEGLKIPHMGWNSVKLEKGCPLTEGIPDGTYFYFVHSYYCRLEDRERVIGTAEYGTELDALVQSGNLYACQFHPEKSSDAGQRLLKNFLSL